jgi:thiamine-monophosphate kinase
MVNISDVASSGAEIKYLTIALSLPNNIETTFIKEFYQGAKRACPNGVEIVGGDITGGDKVFVSVCAIGQTKDRKISSRSHAKIGYKVVVDGNHGSSDIGLKLLLNNKFSPEKFIKAHLEPFAHTEFGEFIGKNIKQDYAMMDTSDGLMNALSTIAKESGVLLNIDFNKIPYDDEIKQFDNWQNSVLFGGEDYGIVAVVPKAFECGGTTIGEVSEGLGVNLKLNGQIFNFSEEDVDKKLFNHFGGN